MKRLPLLVSAVGCVALILVGLGLGSQRGEPSRMTRPESAPMPMRAVRTTDDTTRAGPGRSVSSGRNADVRSVATNAALPDDVRRVLPSLATMPRDWRAFVPARITVAPRAGVEATFVQAKVKRDAGHTTWIGRSDVDGATLVAVASAGSWNALVAFPHGDEFSVAVAGGGVSVVEMNPDLEICGQGLGARGALRPQAGTKESAGAAVADTAALPTAVNGNASADASPVSDVTFFYDASVEATEQQAIDRDALDSTPAEQIENRLRALVEQSNADLARSEVADLSWRFAGVYKLPAYDDQGDKSMETDLETISNSSTTAGRFAQDHAESSGADQIVLYLDKDRDYAGLAWTPGHEAVCAWNTTHMTLAHELAHNLDCNHDRQTLGVSDSESGYNYGYRWNDPVNGDSGTIMSYAGFRIAYFSNPDLTVDGVTIGVAAGQPGAADNARVLRENAADMAAYRTAPDAPVITRQPAGATLTEGDALSLSVTATGGGLSYQWYRGDNAIANATAASYKKSSVTTADAGDYTVIVSNAAGAVTSDVATVTVAAKTTTGGGDSGGTAGGGTTPPPSGGGGTSSGGGGGGGGAPSAWFSAAIFVLALGRGARRYFVTTNGAK